MWCRTHVYVWHDTFLCVTWLIHMCAMTCAYVWHDACICLTWHIYTCGVTSWYVWHAVCYILPYNCITLHHAATATHVYMLHITDRWDVCRMTRSYVWHDSFICVTWLMHMCNSSICVTWLIHMCDMTHAYVRLIHMCDMTHVYVWHDAFIRVADSLILLTCTASYFN